MPNGNGSKRLRKNMNLSRKTFARLERMKRWEEKKVGLPLPWDNFFARIVDEVERLRQPQIDR